jgi:hypothetical protein
MPISPQEFRQLKAELRARDAELQLAPDGTPLVQGSSPWIQDHAMGLYLQKIQSQEEGSPEQSPE